MGIKYKKNKRIINILDVFHTINHVGVINNISFLLTQNLVQRDAIDENLFCDDTSAKSFDCLPREGDDAENNVCFCANRLKVKLNSIVELILYDDTRSKRVSGFYFYSTKILH